MRALTAVLITLSWAVDADGPLPTPPLGSAVLATVSGVVFDSIGGKTLSGALVQVVGVSDSVVGRQFRATSDSGGRYVIRDVPAGRYEVGFFHMSLDTLGITPATRRTDIGAEPLLLDLATPSAATVIRSLCAPNADSPRAGLLLGHVRSATTEEFLENAGVSVTWSEWRSEGGSIQQEIRTAVATTRGNGWFAMCGTPSDAALHVRAGYATDSSGVVSFFVPSDSIRHVSIYVGESRGGTALLSGTVRDAAGRPVPNAIADT